MPHTEIDFLSVPPEAKAGQVPAEDRRYPTPTSQARRTCYHNIRTSSNVRRCIESSMEITRTCT